MNNPAEFLHRGKNEIWFDFGDRFRPDSPTRQPGCFHAHSMRSADVRFGIVAHKKDAFTWYSEASRGGTEDSRIRLVASEFGRDENTARLMVQTQLMDFEVLLNGTTA